MIDTVLAFDKSLFLILNNLGSEFWDPIWILISNKYLMLIIITCAYIYCLNTCDKKHSLFILLSLLICVSITNEVSDLFKNYFMRLRPCWDPEISYMSRYVNQGGKFGFFSAHAANTSVLVSFLLFRFPQVNNLFKFFLILWLLLVCYSRIYLGKHYPLDIIFGVLMGYIIAILIFKLYTLVIKKST